MKQTKYLCADYVQLPRLWAHAVLMSSTRGVDAQLSLAGAVLCESQRGGGNEQPTESPRGRNNER